MSELYRCSPRKIRKFVIECLLAGLVPYVQSSPGMGKSSIMASIAKENNLKMIDHRLSTSEPTDMTGLPRFNPDGTASFAPFADLFPIKGTPLPLDENGKQMDGWMLFLDEFNSAPKSVQAAAYKLILDRKVGQFDLHENVVICAAGNLATDRAIVNPLSTAMQSRVVHLEMQISFDEWLEDVALKQNYDNRIIGYLTQYSTKLMDFRPDHQDKTFCCPRTWEFVNRLVKGKVVTDESALLLAGTITSGTAADFVQFTKIYEKVISVDKILQDPENAPVPSETSHKWAVISHMMEKVNEQNLSGLSTYADRFDMSFRVLFYRSMLVRNPNLRQHPAFSKAAAALARYMNS